MPAPDPTSVSDARSAATAVPDELRARARALEASWHDLAGRLGLPEIIESAAAVLPGSTTSHVVYDLGVAVSLALGDLAEALGSYAVPGALAADLPEPGHLDDARCRMPVGDPPPDRDATQAQTPAPEAPEAPEGPDLSDAGRPGRGEGP